MALHDRRGTPRNPRQCETQPDNAAAGDATITSSDGFTVSGSEFQAVFRATAIEYLNDHQELIHGLQFLKQAIVAYAEQLEAINYGPNDRHEIANPADKAKFFRALCDCIDQIAARGYEHHIHCYTTSFSTKPDVLSQWRGNGGGTSGFPIGVDFSKFPKRRAEGSFFHRQPFLTSVHYGHDKVPAEVTAELEQWLHHWVYAKTQATKPTGQMLSECVRWMSALAARIKHPGFFEEKEWRYVDLNYYGAHAYRDGGTLWSYRTVG